MRRRGLSLLELLIVVATIATLAAIGLPRYGRAVERSAARSAALRCVAELESARDRAIAERRAIAVRFTAGTGLLELAAVDQKPTGGDALVDLGAPPYGIAFTGSSFAGDTVVFDERGLATAGSIVVARGAHSHTVAVSRGGSVAWR